MTCKDCIHYEACGGFTPTDLDQKADAVEVVRCKNCAYYREETSYCLNPHCSSSFYGHRVKENHYCSYGERNKEWDILS